VNTLAPKWFENASTTPGAAPDGARMDTVELLVNDLDALTKFYSEAVTLDVLDQSGDTATLGHQGLAAIRLRQAKELPTAAPGSAGLYHTAVLFESPTRLATSLASMSQHAAHLYEGSADHLVSEAFYFHDPEGNGLELYHDRPRDQWRVDAQGQVAMASLRLNPHEFLNNYYNPDAPTGEGATSAIGHVHLQVGDIPRARSFYEGVLGFDVTMDAGSALFLSAGGYHHHIGMNIWHSAGAGPRAAALGLGDVRIVMPVRDDVEALMDRLRSAGVRFADDGAAVSFTDPWGTQITVAPEK
jgi:catechol 2,3-dioxygenase